MNRAPGFHPKPGAVNKACRVIAAISMSELVTRKARLRKKNVRDFWDTFEFEMERPEKFVCSFPGGRSLTLKSIEVIPSVSTGDEESEE
jgi:hypothetical protein